MTSGFRGFSPWSLGPVAIGPVVRQDIMVRAHGRTKLFNSWKPGSKDTDRERGGTVDKYTLKGHVPNDLLL
jgi:hypothetical protein